jgi:hypothetical protein
MEMHSGFEVFVSNFLIGGWMVSVDAALFLAIAIAFIAPRRRFGVVVMITLAHAFYGFLGLGILMLSRGATEMLGLGIWIIITGTSYLGLRFITEGFAEGGDDDPADHGLVLNRSLISGGALSLYTAVSIDELFAVMQKYQWMTTQGWNHTTMALNIAASMVVLFILLYLAWKTIERSERFVAWLDKHGDRAMFIVFSLIMYYLVRGVVQNGLGYEPWEIPLTGIAPELLPIGFMLTWLLQWGLENKKFRTVTHQALFIS